MLHNEISGFPPKINEAERTNRTGKRMESKAHGESEVRDHKLEI